jgi:hypothetical protein
MSYVNYTEGTWTPVLQFGGASTGITYSKQVGYFRKYGDVVFYGFNFLLTSKGSATGTATIAGLPIASSSVAQTGVRIPVELINGFTFSASYGLLMIGTSLGSTSLLLQQVTNTNATLTSATDANFANNTELQFSGWYFI